MDVEGHCEENGCVGIALDARGRCYIHADDEARNQALTELKRGGPLWFTEGMDINADLLQALRQALTRDGKLIFREANFRKAILRSSDFKEATFEGVTQFDNARFLTRADFFKATFDESTSFNHVQFEGLARFSEASFGNEDNYYGYYYSYEPTSSDNFTEFRDACFGGEAHFRQVQFYTAVLFSNAQFHELCRFSESSFRRQVDFVGAEFHSQARFRETTFYERLDLSGVSVSDLTEFRDAVFHGPSVFVDASFASVGFSAVEFEAEAKFSSTFDGPADFSLAKFNQGAVLRGSRFISTCSLQNARFGAPSHPSQPATLDREDLQSCLDVTGTTFKQGINLRGVEFESNAVLKQFSVSGGASDFTGARFGGQVYLCSLTCSGELLFSNAVCSGDISVEDTQVDGETHFKGAELNGVFSIRKTTLTGGADFGWAKLQRPMSWQKVTCSRIDLTNSVCSEDVELADVRCETVDFTSSMCEGSVRLESLSCQVLNMVGTRFDGSVSFDVIADRINATRCRLTAQGYIRVESPCKITLEQASISVPCVLVGLPDRACQPVIYSLRGANVAGLALAWVDLSPCHFSGAHNLNLLRIENSDAFGSAPPSHWLRFRGTARVGRRVIAEECLLRRVASSSSDWCLQDTAWDAEWLGPEPGPVEPEAVANVYRALRKGREESKDEPGAADFYYGEMEMRRRGSHPISAERAILTVYWALSGYALRASRALIALVFVIVIFAGLYQAFGFQNAAAPFGPASAHAGTGSRSTATQNHHPGVMPSVDSFVYSAGTAASLLSSPEAALTRNGRVLHLVERILGPLLVGLGLLSLRGRVKR